MGVVGNLISGVPLGTPAEVSSAIRKGIAELKKAGYEGVVLDEFKRKALEESSKTLIASRAGLSIERYKNQMIARIEKDKMDLDYEVSRISEKDSMSAIDRLFEIVYDNDGSKGYSKRLRDNRIAIAKTRFDIKRGANKKDKMIALLVESLKLRGYDEKTCQGARSQFQSASEGLTDIQSLSKMEALASVYRRSNERAMIKSFSDPELIKVAEYEGLEGEAGRFQIIRKLLGLDNKAFIQYTKEMAEMKKKKIQEQVDSMSAEYDKKIQDARSRGDNIAAQRLERERAFRENSIKGEHIRNTQKLDSFSRIVADGEVDTYARVVLYDYQKQEKARAAQKEVNVSASTLEQTQRFLDEIEGRLKQAQSMPGQQRLNSISQEQAATFLKEAEKRFGKDSLRTAGISGLSEGISASDVRDYTADKARRIDHSKDRKGRENND